MYSPQEALEAQEALEPLLQKAADKTFGMCSVAVLQHILHHGLGTAFVLLEENVPVFIAIATIAEYATYRTARILAMAGKEMAEAHKYFDALEAWALTQGAVEVEGWVRPGMLRYTRRFGWKPRNGLTLIHKDLRGKLQ